MKYRPYGKTGKMVSLIGMGTAKLSPFKDSFSNNVDLVLKALELGINYFDTAPTYACGESEKILGTAFQQSSGKKFMVTSKSLVGTDPTSEHVLRRIDSSLSALQVDKIDFFHMWSVLTMDQYERIIAPGGPYEGALRAKEKGLIDHICISVHCNGDELERILSDGLFDGVTLGFNALNYKHRLGGLHLAAEKKMGVAIMNPLAGGLIPRKPEYFQNLQQPGGTVVDGAIQFVVSHPEVSTALIGASTQRDLLDAINAIETTPSCDAIQWEEIASRLPVPAEPLCTMCDYCRGCPAGIQVSRLMGAYNEYILSDRDETRFHEWREMYYGTYPFETVTCLKCGRCEGKCTQHLPIIKRIEKINEICGVEAAKQRALCNLYFPQTGYPKTGLYGWSIPAKTMLRAYQYFFGGLPENLCFFDSNPAKWGTRVWDSDYLIYSPDDITKLGVERIIIAAPKYEEEIRDTLKDYVPKEVEIYAL